MALLFQGAAVPADRRFVEVYPASANFFRSSAAVRFTVAVHPAFHQGHLRGACFMPG